MSKEVEKLKVFDISLWEKVIEEEYDKRERDRLETLETTLKALKRYFRNKRVKKVFLVGSMKKFLKGKLIF